MTAVLCSSLRRASTMRRATIPWCRACVSARAGLALAKRFVELARASLNSVHELPLRLQVAGFQYLVLPPLWDVLGALVDLLVHRRGELVAGHLALALDHGGTTLTAKAAGCSSPSVKARTSHRSAVMSQSMRAAFAAKPLLTAASRRVRGRGTGSLAAAARREHVRLDDALQVLGQSAPEVGHLSGAGAGGGGGRRGHARSCRAGTGGWATGPLGCSRGGGAEGDRVLPRALREPPRRVGARRRRPRRPRRR